MRAFPFALLSVAGMMLALPVPAQNSTPPGRPAAPPAKPAAPQSPLPTLNMVVPQRDRDAVYAYYRDEVTAGRCPLPLVKKSNACGAPPANKQQVWKLDQPLPDGVKGEPPPAALIGKISPSPAGYQYMRIDNDILVVGIGTRVVAALVADLSRL